MVLQFKLFAIIAISVIFMGRASYATATLEEGNVLSSSESVPGTVAPPAATSSEEAASIFGIETEIVGNVFFEPRKTRVIPEISRDGVGMASQIYWSVVFFSGENRYLLRKSFFLGQDQAPEFIELNGIPLTPGVLVKVQGQVVTPNPGFHVLLDVNQITLL